MPNKGLSDFLESIGSFFGSGDHLPWTDADIIAKLESDVGADGAGLSPDFANRESIMRLSWALVHSNRPSDVERGIAMLDVALSRDCGASEKRELYYLLAVGYYRAEDYAMSRKYVDQALEIAPDFRQAVNLKKLLEDKITKDGVIGIGLAVTAVGIVGGLAAGLVASLSRKN